MDCDVRDGVCVADGVLEWFAKEKILLALRAHSLEHRTGLMKFKTMLTTEAMLANEWRQFRLCFKGMVKPVANQHEPLKKQKAPKQDAVRLVRTSF